MLTFKRKLQFVLGRGSHQKGASIYPNVRILMGLPLYMSHLGLDLVYEYKGRYAYPSPLAMSILSADSRLYNV